jgi:hypothetical protein
MQKIPTLFVRNPEDRARVLDEVTPGCEWVLAGEGIPTRKYDGTCVMYDGSSWWARREVKPGKQTPANFRPVNTDPATGKMIGWEPIEQSSFAKYHSEALDAPWGIADAKQGQWRPPMRPVEGATYELCGAKVNGNPERVEDGHLLVRHGYTAAVDRDEMASLTAHLAARSPAVGGHRLAPPRRAHGQAQGEGLPLGRDRSARRSLLHLISPGPSLLPTPRVLR